MFNVFSILLNAQPLPINGIEIAHIILSVLIFLLVSVIVIYTTKKKTERFNFNRKLLIFTIGLVLSMWLLQYVADTRDPDFAYANWYERGLLSLYHTIKAFGADDNFLVGLKHLSDVIDIWILRHLYKIYATVLGFIAPLVSATLFLELLATVFPKLKLFLFRYCKNKKKYYFSELNERSLALAKSILEKEKYRTTIIFTDVYANKVQESTTELLAEAKRIGAICLRDDITHIQKSGFGERKYFLIDDNEIKNLQTLTNLTNDFNYEHLENSEIFLFCQDYIYTDVEKQVRQKLEKKYENNTEKQYEDVKPTIIPVRQYRNLITNMLEKTPLYEPIIHKRTENPSGELDLNVTILGIGDIGTEMFLTTYWMGQMLNCKLNINVISKESEKDFWGKIDYINPEIRHTTQENDELLRVYKNKDVFADPYCKVKYYSCDIQSDEFRKLLEGEDSRKTILDTHYFLVSLGSDQANLSIANTLKNRIGKYHIENKDLKTIINYVVYNADLSETLNENQFVCSHSDKPDIYMQAVGGVEQVYQADKIFMNDYIPGAEAAARSYNSKQGKSVREKASKKRLKDEYEYWSNLALRLHFKYKVFSVNLIEESLFPDDKDYESHKIKYENHIETVRLAYKYIYRTYRLEIAEGKSNNKQYKDTDRARFPTVDERLLQWLEHRRWNAFIRTMGIQKAKEKDYENYIETTKSHKHMEIRLHPCLVECEKIKVPDDFKFIDIKKPDWTKTLPKQLKTDEKCHHKIIDREKGYNITGSIDFISSVVPCDNFDRFQIEPHNEADLDKLDLLSLNLYNLKKEKFENVENFNPYDFKQYDYPNNDYLDEIYVEGKQEK